MYRIIKITAIFFMALLLLPVENLLVVQAYFDRGDVTISFGQNSISLEEGQTGSVSVALSPVSESQLPGCGMAECPQICGEKSCLDENGDCQCAGTEYKTYDTDVTVSSDNTNVATAIYNNGVLQIYAGQEGTAVITGTASLRQHNSTWASITVTVKAKSQEAESTPSPAQSQQVEVETVTPGEGVRKVDTQEEETKEENEGTREVEEISDPSDQEGTNRENQKSEENTAAETIKSDKGKITFMNIKPGKMGRKILKKIKGKKAYVYFQKKDAQETVLYSWEFYGKKVKKAQSMDFQIDIDTYEDRTDAILLSFSHQGKLPGKATLHIKVSQWFGDEDSLNLYGFENGSFQLLKKGVEIENGYVEYETEEISNLVFTTGEIKTQKEVREDTSLSTKDLEENPQVQEPTTDKKDPVENKTWMAVLILLLGAGGIGVYIYRKKHGGSLKKSSRYKNDEEDHREEK